MTPLAQSLQQHSRREISAPEAERGATLLVDFFALLAIIDQQVGVQKQGKHRESSHSHPRQ